MAEKICAVGRLGGAESGRDGGDGREMDEIQDETRRQRMLDCRVVRCEQVATETFRLRVTAPELAQMCKGVLPGQFVMGRVPGTHDPLLGRAFAIFNFGTGTEGMAPSERNSLKMDAVRSENILSPREMATATAKFGCEKRRMRSDEGEGEKVGEEVGEPWLEIVFLRVGRATTIFATLTPGERVTLWGPLGNGFSSLDPSRYRHLICVAGGIGQTPMRLVLEEAMGRRRFGRSFEGSEKGTRLERVSFCYGAKSEAGFACLDEFESIGTQLILTTEDGSRGERGRVTGPLERLILEHEASRRAEIWVMACGPEPMLVAVQELLRRYGVQGELSLETPMACGMGICFSCVAKIRVPNSEGDVGMADAWDYRRTCREGPVFPAAAVVFEG